MEFRNLVKAQITQSLLKTLLEGVGYRVTRLGVEELFGEIKYLDFEQYQSLGLPLNLRSLPDLLVAEPDMKKVFLVEVKFRREFNVFSIKGLYKELTEQRKHWPGSYAVIMIAKPLLEGCRFHQDYIRVVRPDQTELLTMKLQVKSRRVPEFIHEMSCKETWDNLELLSHVFPQFNKFNKISYSHAYADLITSTIKDLAKL